MSFKRVIKYQCKLGRDNNGFTLIEVLIAMTIFSIGILAVGKMQISSVTGNTSARKYTEASNFGVSEIETIMGRSYDDPTIVNGSTGTIIQGIYTINWTVTDSVPVPNVKQINIVVTWNNNRSFTANYYKAIIF